MSKLSTMSRKDFYAIPLRESWSCEIECNALVMLPQGTRLHDSGYRFLDAVACMFDEPLCRVAGGSDVFMFGAPSEIWTKERTPQHAVSWGMDSLKRSGLLRIFLFDYNMQIGASLSSLDVRPVMRSVETNNA